LYSRCKNVLLVSLNLIENPNTQSQTTPTTDMQQHDYIYASNIN